MSGGNGVLLLRVGDAADRIGLSRAMLYRLIAEGQISPVHVNTAVRIPVAELERWVESRIAAEAATAGV